MECVRGHANIDVLPLELGRINSDYEIFLTLERKYSQWEPSGSTIGLSCLLLCELT